MVLYALVQLPQTVLSLLLRPCVLFARMDITLEVIIHVINVRLTVSNARIGKLVLNVPQASYRHLDIAWRILLTVRKLLLVHGIQSHALFAITATIFLKGIAWLAQLRKEQ